MSTVVHEGVELLDEGKTARISCRKCGEKITLVFGDMTREEAKAALDKVANQGPAQCPGYHVELGAWRWFWRLPEALEAVYGKE